MSTGSAIIVSVALLLFCVYSAFRKLVVALVVLAVAAFCFGYDDLIGVVSGVTARANVAGVTKQGTLYSITSCAPLSLRINDKTITFQSFPHEETIDYLAAHPESVSAGGSYEVTPKELRWQAARR